MMSAKKLSTGKFRLHRVIIRGLLLCTGLLSFCYTKQTPNKPNIIIIYTEDQGYGDVGVLNPDAKFRTPNMDLIANEGIVFTDGHSSDGVCTPSRYSLLTGRYSWRTSLKKGVLRADGPCLIEQNRMTLASLLKNHGYATAMIGKWHLQMEFQGRVGQNRDWSAPFKQGPVDHGFDYFFGIPASMNYGILTYLENDKVLDPPVLWTKKKSVDDPGSYGNLVNPAAYRLTPPYEDQRLGGGGWVEVAPSFNDEYVLETFTNRALSYIQDAAKEAKNGKPFFMYFPMTSPHLPHSTHPDFRGRSDCGNYGDFMEETDFRVGQILEALKENGIDDNTLVIFSSDNGAETNYTYHREKYHHFSSLHFKGGKRDIYEGGHRVPFLMRWPAMISAGSRSDLPVCQVDLMATFADLLDVDLPEDAGEDSYSLYPILQGHEDLDWGRSVIHHSASGHFAIRCGQWKLNMFRGSGGSLEPKFVEPKLDEPKYELYNLEIDPSEKNNLISKESAIAKALEAKITAIVKNGRSTPGVPQNFVSENWTQVSWMSLN